MALHGGINVGLEEAYFWALEHFSTYINGFAVMWMFNVMLCGLSCVGGWFRSRPSLLCSFTAKTSLLEDTKNCYLYKTLEVQYYNLVISNV